MLAAILIVRSHSVAAERTDFRVNNDIGTTQQDHPRVAVAADGSFIVIWVDYRGASSDIFAQKYNPDGYPAGENLKINDDLSEAYQFEPAVAVDLFGRYSAIWKDYRNSPYPLRPDIFLQHLDSTVTPVGVNVNITNEQPDSSGRTPDIDLYAVGGGVIVWTDYRNWNWDIYGQLIAADGAPLGENFRINDDVGLSQQHRPRVSVSNEGWFVVAWYDKRGGDDDIYCQRFNTLGNPLGPNVQVSEDSVGTRQAFPDVAADGAGHFTVVWVDWQNGIYPANPDIYARKYDTSMTPITGEYRVNTDTRETAQREPTIAADRMGNVSIIWSDSGLTSWDIIGQMVDVDGIVRETNFQANSHTDSLQIYPDVALDGRYRYIVWADKRSGNFDIYASITKYNDPTLVLTPSSVKFEMQIGSTPPASQEVLVEHAGYNPLDFRIEGNMNWLNVSPATGRTPLTVNVSVDPGLLGMGTYFGSLVFVDISHADSSTVLSVRLDVTSPVMSVLPTNIACSGFAGVDEPHRFEIAVLNDGIGQFAWTAAESVTWIDITESSGLSPDTVDAFLNAQYLSVGTYSEPIVFESTEAFGAPDTVWAEFEVVDNLPYLQVMPDSFYIRRSVGMTTDTSVMVTNPGVGVLDWSAASSVWWLTLSSTFGQAGEIVDFIVDHSNLSTGVYVTSVNFVDDGSFNVEKQIPYILDLYKSSSDLITLEPVNVFRSQSGVMPIRLSLTGEASRLYLPLKYDPGVIAADSVQFSSEISSYATGTSAIDNETGRLIVELIAASTVPVGDYLMADFHFTGKAIDATTLVDTAHFDTCSVYLRSSAGEKLTPTVEPGMVTVGQPTDVDDKPSGSLPRSFKLYPNYPNPFNPSTTIGFDLPRRSYVELVVFNILGQEIRRLREQSLPAGHHQAVWSGDYVSGQQVPSGIYFYRLRTGDISRVGKMVLLK